MKRRFVRAASYIALLAICLIALTGMVAGCTREPSGVPELLVFAAASLGDALVEIEEAYEVRTRVGVRVSYGGSQMLAQQIASGAPADVLISAGRFPVDFLAHKGLIEPVTTDILTNRLVLAVRSGSELRLESIDQLRTSLVRRLAVANPDLAPAGAYARESLTQLGIWDEVQPRLVYGADVRATLAYVESGNADAALVYITDAKAGRDIEVLEIVPVRSYPEITYPVAVVSRSQNKEAAQAFVKFLRSAVSREIFRRHGFQPAE